MALKELFLNQEVMPFKNPKFSKIILKIDYNFSKDERGFEEYDRLTYLVRAHSFNNAIKE